MTSHGVAAWSLALILAACGPLAAPLERHVYGSACHTRRKLIAYGTTMVVLWTLAAAAVWLCGWPKLLSSPAAPAAWPPGGALTAAALSALAGLYGLAALLPLIQSLRGPRWRIACAAALRRACATLPGLLPNTGAERAAFILVCLSAGFCEEVLFRGFLIRLLHSGALACPLAGALAASSLIVGLGHAYQGASGVLRTAVAGVFLGLVFLLSGSLPLAMVLHALLDMQVVYVLWPASTGSNQAALASAGSAPRGTRQQS
jgi:membrane protease YdiL (CAAX protease family)